MGKAIKNKSEISTEKRTKLNKMKIMKQFHHLKSELKDKSYRSFTSVMSDIAFSMTSHHNKALILADNFNILFKTQNASG